MKKLIRSRAFRPICTTTLYLLLLAAGVSAYLIVIVWVQQGERLETVGYAIADDFFSEQSDSELLGNDTGAFFYDVDGTCLSCIKSEIYFPDLNPDYMDKYVSTVLEGKKICRAIFVSERFDIVAMVGLPITNGDNIIGVVFVLRNIKNLPESIVVFMCYFTFFY